MDKLSLLLWIQVTCIAVALDYETRCPAAGEWRFRGRKFNCGRTQYVCLLHTSWNIYYENCDGLDYSSTGSKLIFEPFFNKALCSYNRYQPFYFSTDGSSKCVYQKSDCNEKGQYVFHKGSLTSDTTCGCDLSSGYEFVSRPKNNCYCIPTEEDCSCYKLPCYEKDEQCPKDHDTITKLSEDSMFTPLIEDILNDRNYSFNDHSNGINNRLQCMYISMVLLVVMITAVCLFVGLRKTLQRVMRLLIKSPAPNDFDIFERTSFSITVKWVKRDLEDGLKYQLDFRLQTSDCWKSVSFLPKHTRETKDGCQFDLINLFSDTYYELKMCFVQNGEIKSLYTDRRTTSTLKIAPQKLMKLPSEDISIYKNLLQSTQTEERYFVKVVIVGKSHTGKTSLMRRLLQERISDVCCTDGVDIVNNRCKIDIKDGKWQFNNGRQIDMCDDRKCRIERAIIQRESIEKEVPTRPLSAEVFPKLDVKPSTLISSSEQRSISHLDNVLTSTKDIGNVEGNESKNTNNTFKENENLSSSLVMPEDIISQVLSFTSCSYMPSNHYALCGLWDCAGLPEFLSTHNAFLTSSATYLVVADMDDDISSKSVRQNFDEMPHAGGYVGFWFDTIHCFRTFGPQEKEGINGSLYPSVIMVFTGKDRYNDEEFQQRSKELKIELEKVSKNQGKFQHLSEIYFLSITNDPDDIFEKLRLDISKEAKKNDTWGKSVPLKWILLEHLIDMIRNSNTSYININDMIILARHSDINILEEQDLDFFLSFQHEIGNILFFKDIPELIILDPKWLSNAIRCLVSNDFDYTIVCRSSEMLNDFVRFGKISESFMSQLIASKLGSHMSTQTKWLIKVMEKFDILVKIDDKPLYIMPSRMAYADFEYVCKEIGFENYKHENRTSWLCLKFEFLPHFFFHNIVVWLLRKYGTSKMENKLLYRRVCVFGINKFSCKLFCTMASNTIALQLLSLSVGKTEFGSICSEIYNELKKQTEVIQKRYNMKIPYELHFKCSTGHYFHDTRPYQYFKNEEEYSCDEHKTKHKYNDVCLPWMKNENEMQ